MTGLERIRQDSVSYILRKINSAFRIARLLEMEQLLIWDVTRIFASMKEERWSMKKKPEFEIISKSGTDTWSQ